MYGRRSSIRWYATATYAVPASNVDGQICVNVPHAGRSLKFFVTSFHCAPLSFVYQSLPSLVPAQISPRWIFEYSMSHTTSPSYWPRLSPTMPPFETTLEGSFVDRSGLNSVHDWPPFDVLRISWQP